MPRGPKPLKKKLKQNEFYCVKCRGRSRVSSDEICFRDIKNKKRRNNKVPMLQSECHKCGTGLNKIVKNSKAGDMRRKFGRC